MVIKSTQINHLKGLFDRDLKLLIMGFLVEHYPEEIKGIDIQVLLNMIEVGIDRSRKMGFSQKNTITIFTTWMFIIAPNFDEYIIIKQVLDDEDLSEDMKIEEINNRMKKEDWEQAVYIYDENIWLSNVS
jgi:hypothetical protein